MAVWQFQCNIIPMRVDVDGLSHDEIISWKNVYRKPHEIVFLQREKSWSKDIVQYGNSEETCIEFIYVHNKLEEINCRLDLRSLTKQNFISLIEYVQEIEAMFFVEGMIYPPKADIMIEVIKNSKANQYCKNPIGYIRGLGELTEL